MNLIRTSRNIAIIALLLSLLFHCSTILYIFSQKTRNSANTIFEHHKENTHLNKPNEQKNNTEWVETRARAGDFGAPVFFEDIIQDPSNNTAESLSEIVPQTPETLDIPKADIQPQKDIFEKIHTQEERASHQKKPAMIEQTIKKRAQKANPPQRKKTTRKKQQANPFAHTPKPPLTLAQLTQGFLHQRKELSGTYGISMLGKRGIPSDEQMKYERYLQKLSWCIQNSFKIHEQKHPIIAENTTIDLFFALTREGTLQELYIKKSSGNMYVDQFFLFIFRDASSSFPPLPHYLSDNPLKLVYRHSIIIEHPY